MKEIILLKRIFLILRMREYKSIIEVTISYCISYPDIISYINLILVFTNKNIILY